MAFQLYANVLPPQSLIKPAGVGLLTVPKNLLKLAIQASIVGLISLMVH